MVFIKVHKCASSTTTTILQRYGITHNKTFALPATKPYWAFDLKHPFNANMTMGYNELRDRGDSTGSFDILMNHARYNRPEMDKVVKDAFYLAAIRNPVSHFESAFVYFEIRNYDVFKHFENRNNTHLISIFVNNPKYYFDKLGNGAIPGYLWNGQAFDLGLDSSLFNNFDYITGAIQRLSHELDLVLIKEYYDESLILMKKYLCLEYVDILYVSQGVRGTDRRAILTDSIKRKIALWNTADMRLYQHFNKTLWIKVKEYGPTFWDDLEIFRRLKNKVTDECRSQTYSTTFPSMYCKDFKKGENQNSRIVRQRTRRILHITAKYR